MWHTGNHAGPPFLDVPPVTWFLCSALSCPFVSLESWENVAKERAAAGSNQKSGASGVQGLTPGKREVEGRMEQGLGCCCSTSISEAFPTSRSVWPHGLWAKEESEANVCSSCEEAHHPAPHTRTEPGSDRSS